MTESNDILCCEGAILVRINLGLSIIIFVLSWNVLLFGVQKLEFPYFDETRYVPAAGQFIHGGVNENWVHPPLAKWLISIGIRTFGDNPLGWRVMSTIFGAATVSLMFLLGLLLFGGRVEALTLAALTMLNQVHYVQARVATLDVFMTAFIIAGTCAIAWIWMKPGALSPRVQGAAIALGTLAFGLAIACKWFAVAPAAVCILLVIARLDASASARWTMGLLAGAMTAAVICYFLVSSMLLKMSAPDYQTAAQSEKQADRTYSPGDLIRMQLQIARKQLAFQNQRHPYTSEWYTWPLVIRPMWYSFYEHKTSDGEKISAIYLVGNLAIYWFGFVAVFVCGWFAIRRSDPAAIMISSIFFASWLVWAVLPRKIGFFYYYYPAAMFLSPALIETKRKLKIGNRLWIPFLLLCLASFVFFFPLLCGLDFPPATIWPRLIFKSWIR